MDCKELPVTLSNMKIQTEKITLLFVAFVPTLDQHTLAFISTIDKTHAGNS